MNALHGPQQVGTITYTNTTCPVCGAVTKIGTQAVSPTYTYVVQCAFCGTVLSTAAVSAEIVSGPTVYYYPTQETSGFDWNIVMNIMMLIMMMSTVAGLYVPEEKEKYLPSTYTERLAAGEYFRY